MMIKHRPYAECALNKWYYLNTLTCRLLLLIYITWLFSSAGMHSPEVHTGARLQHRHSLACRALVVDGHLDSPTSSALVTSDVWRDPCQSHVCAVLALHHTRACLFSHVTGCSLPDLYQRPGLPEVQWLCSSLLFCSCHLNFLCM